MTLPLLIWLLIQLAALLLAALQVPFSARFPQPADRLALDEMIVIQIAAASVIFPFLLRNVQAAAGAIAAAIVFQQLAALFAAVPPVTAMLTGVFVACWLATLALWNIAIDSARGRRWAVALAVCFAMGGPLLWYLRMEFSRGSSLHWPTHGLLGPIMGSLALLHAPGQVWSGWLMMIGLLVSGAVAVGIAQQRRNG